MRYGARELARIISESTTAVRLAMEGLEPHKGVGEDVVEINRLENEADRMHLEAVKRLFEEEKDPILIFKWKEIFDWLEDATDRCEDVADVIEGVVLKNALRRRWSSPSSPRSSRSRSPSTSSTVFTTPPTRSRQSFRPGCCRPGKAVLWSAFFNFVAAFLFGTAVATTIGNGMIERIDLRTARRPVVTFAVIFAGLFGAIVWDLITWYFGLPTSSSHALIGGYAGAAVAKAGSRRDHSGRVDQDARLHRPLAADRHGRGPDADDGDLLALPADATPRARRPAGSGGCSWSRPAFFSLTHGANDAQKTMGIIAGVLLTGGYIQTASTSRSGWC